MTDRFASGTQSLEREWLLLCACVSPSCDLQRVRQSLAGALDWDALLELADQHAVQGILAKRFEELAFEGVPLTAREKLHARIRAQHLFTLSLTAELFRVLDDFAAVGLEVLVIKGPVTSVVAYGDPSMRGFGDIDLLLRQRDIARASQCMRAQGFEPRVPDHAIQAGKIPGEYVFHRSGTNGMVEIHTEQTFRYYPKGMPIEEMFQHKRMVSLEGRNVPALDIRHEVVFHCVHGAKDFWERLMWISDVASLAKSHPDLDWLGIQQFAAQCGSERMLYVGVLLAHRVLGAPLPSALASTIAGDEASLHLCEEIETWLPFGAGAPPSLLKRAVYRLQIAGGGNAGVSYLLRLSLSPTEEDWTQGTPQNRSWLRDALRRPFRLIRKYGPQN